MTSDPDQIRGEIESTRRDLSADVDALTEKVSPSRVVQRRAAYARHSLANVKDKIMGTVESTASSAGDKVKSAASDVAGGASSTTSDATDLVTSMPHAARRQARGNPLAAGLIAFGTGWLVSSLLPASRTEQQLARQATDAMSEPVQPIAQQLGQAAREVKENLREPAQQGVETVKTTASRAASTVADQSRSAAGDVAGRAGQAKDTVTDGGSPGPADRQG